MPQRTHLTMRIEGMTCAGCAKHVAQALRAAPGVDHVEMGDWQQGTAVVVAASDLSEEKLLTSVVRAGYRAVVQSRRLLREGRRTPQTEGAEFDLMTIGGGSAAFA
ncbi:MAG: mercury(II) reductase, partial [Nitrospiraceae bacterium]